MIVEKFNNRRFIMPTVNFSVPDDIKQAFNAEFEGQNKSAVLAALMREAVERAQAERNSREAVDRILSRRPSAPERSSRSLAAARRAGRR